MTKTGGWVSGHAKRQVHSPPGTRHCPMAVARAVFASLWPYTGTISFPGRSVYSFSRDFGALQFSGLVVFELGLIGRCSRVELHGWARSGVQCSSNVRLICGAADGGARLLFLMGLLALSLHVHFLSSSCLSYDSPPAEPFFSSMLP